MNELPYMAAFLAALLVGGVCGIRLEETTLCRTARRRRNRAAEKPRRKMTASKLIALAVLTVDGSATYVVLYLCHLAIVRDYAGALPYLTTLIGALQAVTGVFAWMAVKGTISQDFMTIYAVIIAFYFGTQSQKVQDAVDGGTDGAGN